MASILVTPHITEQLSPYTSDPETSSVSSRAPSYISAAPAYDHVVSSPGAVSLSGNGTSHAQGDGISSLSPVAANDTTTPVKTTMSGLATARSSAASVQQPTTLAPPHSSTSGQSSQHHQQARFARTSGLPNHPFAEGFIPRLPGSLPNSICFDNNLLSSRRPRNTKAYLNSSSCTNDWPSTRNSHATKQYHAVATRRAREGRDGLEQVNNNSKSNIKNSLNFSGQGKDGLTGISRCEDAAVGIAKGILGVRLGVGLSASSSPSTEEAAVGASAPAPEVRTDNSIADPLEDPYLVGEDAAKRAKETRIYREMCLREAEAMRGEGKVCVSFSFHLISWYC